MSPLASTEPPRSGHVTAPFHGIVSLLVREGQRVGAGEVVATIEAMKMEAAITAPHAGTVTRLALRDAQTVAGGDLVVVLS